MMRRDKGPESKKHGAGGEREIEDSPTNYGCADREKDERKLV